MTGHEHRLPGPRSLGAQPQEVRCGRRLPILVDTQEGHVEAPAGEVEVVGISTKSRDVLFRRKHQPDVVIALVPVHEVLPALVERHGLAGQPAVGGVLAVLFQTGQRLLPRFVGLRLREPGNCPPDVGPDVVDAHEHRYGLLAAA